MYISNLIYILFNKFSNFRIIAGRHLCRPKKGISSPFVEIEVIGAPFDAGVKLVTKRVSDNGFNPIWNDEACSFVIHNPHFAMLRFLVQDEDAFGEPNFIGQATYSVSIYVYSIITPNTPYTNVNS